MLLRKHFASRHTSYFSNPSIIGITSPLPFPFKNEVAYRRKIQQLYDQSSSQTTTQQWFTPVELFKPFYSIALANCIAQHTCDYDRLRIIELGPGTGRNARAILDHLADFHPELYNKKLVEFVALDTSAHLLETARKTVTERVPGHVHDHDHSHLFLGVHGELCADENPTDLDGISKLEKILQDNVADLSDSTPPATLNIVVALELLDNLGHDKIRIRNSRKKRRRDAVPTSELQLETLRGKYAFDQYFLSPIIKTTTIPNSPPQLIESSVKLTDPVLSAFVSDPNILKSLLSKSDAGNIVGGERASLDASPEVKPPYVGVSVDFRDSLFFSFT